MAQKTAAPVAMTPEERRALVKRNIAIATAPAWMPEPGTSTYVELIMVKKGDGDYGTYPILVMAPVNDDGSLSEDFIAIHAFHTLLKEEILKRKPVKGWRGTITYVGKREGNQSEKDYRAAVAAAEGDPVKLAEAEQARRGYHLYVIFDGDGTSETAEALGIEEFSFDAE